MNQELKDALEYGLGCILMLAQNGMIDESLARPHYNKLEQVWLSLGGNTDITRITQDEPLELSPFLMQE